MRRAAARRRTQPPLADLPDARRAAYPGFIGPCLATARTSIPAHGHWIHEIKHDGSPYLCVVISDNRRGQIPLRQQC